MPRIRRAAAGLAALYVASACGDAPAPSATTPARPSTDAPAYVGSATCGGCHPEALRLWTGSHHDLAMQPAGEGSVLGDFDGAEVTHFGVTSRFFRRGDAYVVQTEGADGEGADFDVAFVFGVAPLQQLLIALPGGRLQALGLAWDARPAQAGGQRWYPLYPDERIAPGDPLHWTGRAQRWNLMCAECHSTGLHRGYDPETDGYQTTWEEIDVACEACHGPGSAHVESDGRAALPVDFGAPGTWRRAPGDPVAHRAPPRASHTEVETCAPCHARRSRLVDDAEPGGLLLDAFLPALLEEGLYHADGQILDEVYVYGSFLQSRMYAAGVTCSDCHEPHGLALRAEGNALCTSCHAPERYDVAAHHRHAAGAAGSRCVDCHMPARVYMGVDVRRDHGFRVPRPDLAAEIGVPDPCSGCHADHPAEWAAAQVAQWRGGAPPPHFARAIHAGRRGLPGAEPALAELAGDVRQPPIVRASALQLLGEVLSPASAGVVAASLGDADAWVRVAAAGAAAGVDPVTRGEWLAPLLSDPIRAVRIEAARALAGVRPLSLPERDRATLEASLAEYRAAQRANADRPEAHLNLGILAAVRGNARRAAAAYQRAIALEPGFVAAHVNLADLHRAAGRDDRAEQALERALDVAPDDADVLHPLGLLRVRQRRLAEALELLRRASEADPERTRYATVYGVALHSEGRTAEALEVLEAARARRPADRGLLYAVATISRDAGNAEAALGYARALRDLRPGDPAAAALVRELEAARE